ncbi:MAG: hypothetical protein RLZZ143_60 [Cyanobacteriota bacterium]|jgi:cellulose biosynthesis protein BcsQ
MSETWLRSLKQKLTDIYVQKEAQKWVDLNLSTAGLLNITIVSDKFENLSTTQRIEAVKNDIGQQHKSLGFISLYTIQEAASLDLKAPQLLDEKSIHTWQDLALWSTNPQNQSPSSPELCLPRTVTFYSFKGGVGRTTALIHVAWILAMRGRKVVAVDLDLEAPGLSTAFPLNPLPEYGIVDYFYEKSYLPEGVEAKINITEIFGEVNIPDATGRLFIVPAGDLSLDYITKVDDLRATTILDNGETLWSTFSREIQNQLKPDLILVDSRTGINEWGALSLLQAANEAIIFLFPNEQNQKGIELLLQSLTSFGRLSLNFVFSPVPDLSDTGITKVIHAWQILQKDIDKNIDIDETTDHDLDIDSEDYIIIPYIPSIALADRYPVTGLLDYYTRIANLIDEDTNEIRLQKILASSKQRWQVIESLNFMPLNAGDIRSDISLLFQKTANFDKFLDQATCLIRGRKGTGKTALYLLLLRQESEARKLAYSRLDNVTLLSGHGSYNNSRPSRDEFQYINQELLEKQGTWEAVWRAYLLINVFKNFKNSIFPKGQQGAKFQAIKRIFQGLPSENWQSEHTQALVQLATDRDLTLLIKDALDLVNQKQLKEQQTLWFLYDDLDEDFPEREDIRQQALTGLFQFVRACDARTLTAIRFKIFLREDIWKRLNFDNKSHFNGRDLLLQWTRIDFLRLALRQAFLSPKFKELVARFAPVESIDQATEEALNHALELLWGSRRRSGNKAKYVYRWVYERLTDSSGTTFPRSLSALLQGAKEQELTYKGQSSIQSPTDRLLRAKSLEIGLERASEERCEAIRQEYPDLENFFRALERISALPSREELSQVWERTARSIIPDFDRFAELLSEIGLAQWREKEKRYGFADIYVYGFKMIRTGTK